MLKQLSSSGSVKSVWYIPRRFASQYIPPLFTSPSGEVVYCHNVLEQPQGTEIVAVCSMNVKGEMWEGYKYGELNWRTNQLLPFKPTLKRSYRQYYIHGCHLRQVSNSKTFPQPNFTLAQITWIITKTLVAYHSLSNYANVTKEFLKICTLFSARFSHL